MRESLLHRVAGLHLVRSSHALVDRCAELFGSAGAKRLSVLCENAAGEIELISSSEAALAETRRLESPADIAFYRSASAAPFTCTRGAHRELMGLELDAFLPLSDDGERYGAVAIHELAKDSEEEELLLIGDHFGAALLSAQLGEETLRRSRQDADKLSTVVETADVLRELALDAVLSKLLQLATSTVSAEVGCIRLSGAGSFNQDIDWGLPADVAETFTIQDGKNLFDFVLGFGNEVVIRRTSDESAATLDQIPGVVDSLIALPLRTEAGCVGLIVLLNAAGIESSDLELLRTVVDLCSKAIENAILHERSLEKERLSEQLRIAGEIQQNLLPKAPPQIPGLEFAAWNDPCDESGGDYFDVIQTRDSRVGFSVGDAAGHGIGAALLITTARALLRALIQEEPDLARLLDRINDLAEADFADDRFITLALARYDSSTRELAYIGAGHDPAPLLYRSSQGTVRELGSHGLPLGMFRGIEYEPPEVVTLQTGDVFMMLSDGIHETVNPAREAFGKPRVAEILSQEAARPPAEIVQILGRDVLQFRGSEPQQDDLTVLCIKAV